MKHILSLGAGVQSTTMALMAAHGEITPMPDAAVFADTQAEPKAVYQHLQWLMSSNVLPFPVHVVTAGSLREKIGRRRPHGQWPHQPIPAFVKHNDSGSMVNRSCTQDYKLKPIIKQIRALTGLTKKRAPAAPVVTQWIGISLDEVMRMRPARHNWISNRWPLIELRMNRGDCLAWLDRHGYPRPTKSACTFCPYHSDALWRDMKCNDPASWADAVAVDHRLRSVWLNTPSPKTFYLHRDCVPLDQVDFSTLEDHGQLNLFNNECEGMCGV